MPARVGTLRSRLTAYAGLSTALAAVVILKSLAQRPNLYSAAVYLSQSSANVMILCNLVFVTACSFLLLLQKLLYGPLRPIEIEQLYEKAWYAVTETCLAMTIFRGEIGAWFLVMFFSLLAGKVWGWIGEGRVEVMEQQQNNILAGRNARLFHLRLFSSLALSVIFDICMLDYTVSQVLHMARPDMMVMFGFEFAILAVTSSSTMMRYALHLFEGRIVQTQKKKRVDAIRQERVEAAVRAITPQDGEEDVESRRRTAAAAVEDQTIDETEVEVEGWEGKGRWTFYLDLTTDFLKLCIYLSFFCILLIFYGLPLHIMRDVFLTCRSFFKRIADFVRYRNATKDMNERYPDATEADIGREEVCIICREEMRVYTPPAQGVPVDPVAERMRPKKLPCGHVLHFACLRSWLERQQICPTCRATVAPATQNNQGAARTRGGDGRAHNAQHAGNGRPRVYQLGPLRIGVGAIRGNDLLDQLDQQMANPNVPAVEGQNGNAAPQYGFGIRWEGTRRRGGGRTHHTRPIQDQLSSVERQLQREVDSLQASMGEMQALRNVQAQLARIRLAGTGLGTQHPGNATRQNAILQNRLNQLQERDMYQMNATRAANGPPMPTATVLRAHPQQNVLSAGSDQLPNGLTLPEGWSMMPLEAMRPNGGPMQMQMPLPPGMPFQMPMGMNPMFNGAHPHVLQHNPVMPNPPNLAGQQHTQTSATQGQATAMPPSDNLPQGGASTNSQAGPEPLVSGGSQLRDQPASSAPDAQPQSASMATNEPSLAPSPSTNGVPHLLPSQAQPTLHPSSPSPPRDRSSVPTATANAPRSSQPLSPHGASINPPQRFAAPMSPPTLNANGFRTPSPHRQTKSIGSSWGFGGVEDTDTKEDKDDEEDEDEDDLPDFESSHHNRSPTKSSNGRPNTSSSRAKKARVDDVGEDPD